jgi:hypothetical protein
VRKSAFEQAELRIKMGSMIASEIARNHSIDSNALEVLMPKEREGLLVGLAGKLHQSLCAADENLGHLEEQLLRGGHELFRQMLEKAAQQKAAAAPPLCPHCQNKLSRVTDGHWTTIQTRFGSIRVQRARGYCKRCRNQANKNDQQASSSRKTPTW